MDAHTLPTDRCGQCHGLQFAGTVLRDRPAPGPLRDCTDAAQAMRHAVWRCIPADCLSLEPARFVL